MKNKLNDLTDKSFDVYAWLNNIDVLTNDIYNQFVDFGKIESNMLIKNYLKNNETRVSIARRYIIEALDMVQDLHNDILQLTQQCD